MAEESKHSPGIAKNKIVLGGLIIILIIVVVFAVTGTPPLDRDSAGAIGAAKKYQAEQISEEDVLLDDPEFQALLQSDVFQELIRRKDFQELLARTEFLAMAGSGEMNKLLNTAGLGVAEVFLDPAFETALQRTDERAVSVITDDFVADLYQLSGPDNTQKFFTGDAFSTMLNSQDASKMVEMLVDPAYAEMIKSSGISAEVLFTDEKMATLLTHSAPKLLRAKQKTEFNELLALQKFIDLYRSNAPDENVTRIELEDFLKSRGYSDMIKDEAMMSFLLDATFAEAMKSHGASLTAVITAPGFDAFMDHHSRNFSEVADMVAPMLKSVGQGSSKLVLSPDFGQFLKRHENTLSAVVADPGFNSLLEYSANRDLLRYNDYTSLLRLHSSSLRDLLRRSSFRDILNNEEAIRMFGNEAFPKLMRSQTFKTLAARQDWDHLTLEK